MNGLQHINQIPYAYIEKMQGTTLLVDFVESGAYQSFLDIIVNVSGGNTILSPSMVLITNYKGKKVREGTAYRMNEEALQTLLANNQISINQQGSLIIGYQIDMSGVEEELFLRSKSFSSIERLDLNIELFPKKYIPEVHLEEDTKVLIRDVGQGSWNELWVGGKVKLVFDIGTCWQAKRSDVIDLVKNKESKFQEDKPGIVISHWDIDHYHCLVGMTDEALSSINFLCARNYLPTMTSRMIYHRIRRLIGDDKMYPIEPFPKPEKSLGYAPLRKMDEHANSVIFYNACQHRNRNQNAICLAIRKSKSSIVLPADTHYKQISNCILPDLAYESNHYLVVPHHGGKAGKFLYDLDKLNQPTTAIVSVGKNHYGHPRRKYLEQLREKGFKIKQTNSLKKDFEIDLN